MKIGRFSRKLLLETTMVLFDINSVLCSRGHISAFRKWSASFSVLGPEFPKYTQQYISPSQDIYLPDKGIRPRILPDKS